MLDLDFIEACYATSADDVDWTVSLAEAMARLLKNASSVMAAAYYVSKIDGLCYGELGGDARYVDDKAQRASTLARLEHVNRGPDRALKLRPFTNPKPSIFAVSELPRAQQGPLRASMPWPAGDILGIFGTLDGTDGFVIGPSGPESLTPSPRRRRQLERMSEHLGIGYWLRRMRAQASVDTGSSAEAVYHPDGRPLHLNRACANPSLNLRLVDAVRRLDRARCRRQKRSPDEATALWQGLLEGQYALVETFERDGRRLILAVRCRSLRPQLTPCEAAVTATAARGLGNKLIAQQLGMAHGTVAAHLRTGLRKLCCPNRRLLAQWLGSQQPWTR